MKRARVSIRDLAREAGFSVTTVSRVLSKSPFVKESTRQKILAIIRKHQYEPSYVAINLSQSRANTAAVVIDEIANPFFVTVGSAIESKFRHAGYTMMLASSQWSAGNELEILRNLVRHRVAGIILAPVDPNSDAVGLVVDQGIPLVLVNARSDVYPVDCVTTDNHRGGYLACSHLIACGVDNLYLVSGYEHQSTAERVAGFRRCAEDNPTRATVIREFHNINTYGDGYSLAEVFIAGEGFDRDVKGLFVTNDNVAMGLMDGLLDKGVAVPETVKVVGYDNIEFSARGRVPLTTIEQPQQEIGRTAAAELMDRIADPNKKPNIVVFPPRLIERSSTAPS